MTEGVVYACVQPCFAGASTFEWSSLDLAQRTGCRKVVQRIFARIETTSFGERRQYVNDAGTITLLSIIGLEKTIFLCGCLKRDVTADERVATEMDRLLVAAQRAYSHHIARPSQPGRGRASQYSAEQTELDPAAVAAFDAAVQGLIDASSNRVAEIIGAQLSFAASGGASGGANSSGAQAAISRVSYLSKATSGGGFGGNESVLSGHSQQAAAAAVAAYYTSGAGGACEEPLIGGDDDDDDEDEIAALAALDGRSVSCWTRCCTTRVKFVMCFLLVCITGAVLFVVLFACRKQLPGGRSKISCS